MSFAYLPLYTGDYRRDTADLTLAEHGAYLLLLAHCWDSRGPVPSTIDRACRIVGATTEDERKAVAAILGRYFKSSPEGWHNPRLSAELDRANSISGQRSAAGKAGAAKHWASKHGSNGHGNEDSNGEANAITEDIANGLATDEANTEANSIANAKQLSLPTPTPILTPPPPPLKSSARSSPKRKTGGEGSRLPEDWKLPDDWKTWALGLVPDPQQVVRISLKFRDHWLGKPGKDGRKADWFATWRNWVRTDLERGGGR